MKPVINKWYNKFAPKWNFPKYHKVRYSGKDCQLRSICNSIGVPYQKVYERMFNGGWRPTKSTTWDWQHNMRMAFYYFGYTMKLIPTDEVYVDGKLDRTKNLLVYMHGLKPRTPNGKITAHITAIKNGVVIDHLDSRTHKYNWERFYEITPRFNVENN